MYKKLFLFLGRKDRLHRFFRSCGGLSSHHGGLEAPTFLWPRGAPSQESANKPRMDTRTAWRKSSLVLLPFAGYPEPGPCSLWGETRTPTLHPGGVTAFTPVYFKLPQGLRSLFSPCFRVLPFLRSPPRSPGPGLDPGLSPGVLLLRGPGPLGPCAPLSLAPGSSQLLFKKLNPGLCYS